MTEPIKSGQWSRLCVAAIIDRALPAEAVRVLGLIAAAADYDTKTWQGSQEWLSRRLGITDRQIRRHIEVLEKHGYLSVERQKRKRLGGWGVNRYTLKYPPADLKASDRSSETDRTPDDRTPDVLSQRNDERNDERNVGGADRTPDVLCDRTPDVLCDRTPDVRYISLSSSNLAKPSPSSDRTSGVRSVDPYQSLVRRITKMIRISDEDAGRWVMRNDELYAAQEANTLTDATLYQAMMDGGLI